ncbi:MAG: hypothetical protein GXP43_00565 [bacterium]|nr:hypothetical protein [bacterium]
MNEDPTWQHESLAKTDSIVLSKQDLEIALPKKLEIFPGGSAHIGPVNDLGISPKFQNFLTLAIHQEQLGLRLWNISVKSRLAQAGLEISLVYRNNAFFIHILNLNPSITWQFDKGYLPVGRLFAANGGEIKPAGLPITHLAVFPSEPKVINIQDILHIDRSQVPQRMGATWYPANQVELRAGKFFLCKTGEIHVPPGQVWELLRMGIISESGGGNLHLNSRILDSGYQGPVILETISDGLPVTEAIYRIYNQVTLI